MSVLRGLERQQARDVNMNIIGIDPASIGNIGMARVGISTDLQKEKWVDVFNLFWAEEITLNNNLSLTDRLFYATLHYWDNHGIYEDMLSIEVSHICGKGNDNFQRAIGMLAGVCRALAEHETKFIPAVRVKSFFKVKTKQELAKKLLSYNFDAASKKEIRRLIRAKQWNATDAIAIAIAGYYEAQKKEQK